MKLLCLAGGLLAGLRPLCGAEGATGAGEGEAAWTEWAGAFSPSLGVYSYNIRWQGLTAGKARIRVAHDGDGYLVATRAGTENLARHLLTATYDGSARVSDSLLPCRAMEDRNVRGRRVLAYAEFATTGPVDITRVKVRPGRPLRSRELRLEEAGGAVDPFTAVLRARAVPWRPGLSADFVLLIGETVYDLTLTCTGGTRVELDGRKRPAWRLRPSLRVHREGDAPGDADAAEERRDTVQAVERARIYLAREPGQDILRITTETALGDFDVVLTDVRLDPAR